jgi:dual specificity phosphatase 12
MYLRCRHCRQSIVAASVIEQHDTACQVFFVDPTEWEHVQSSITDDGKLQCPHCRSKIGRYSWSGHKCTCGKWMAPAFSIHKIKVDPIYNT